MIETHDFDGFWWLPADRATGPPSDAAKRLTGRLRVTRGRAELDVLGHFGHTVLSESGDQVVYSPVPADVPRILGLTTKGTPITLELCGSTKSSMNFPGIPTTTYRASAVLIGAWFEEGEEIAFDEFALRTTELDTWIGVSGFKHELHTADLEGGLSTATGIDIHFEPPEPITVALDNGEEVRLSFGFTWSGLTPVPVEAKIAQRASLDLRYAESRGLDHVARSVGQLRNFLSLAVGKPVTVLSVTGYKDDFVREPTGHREPIQLLWPVPNNPEVPERELHPTEMLFTRPEAEPDLEHVLRAWFAHQDLFEPVFNLYFSMLYRPDVYREVHFLLYAQAIETYDFRRRDPYELDRAEHSDRLTQILDGTPEEWRDWLRTKLLSSNYRVLDQRIRDVLHECPLVSQQIVGSTQADEDTFVTLVKHTRNYHTHYTPALERKAASGVALYLLIVQLRAVIEMSLLRELGFSCESIDRILGRVQRYTEIAHFKASAASETP